MATIPSSKAMLLASAAATPTEVVFMVVFAEELPLSKVKIKGSSKMQIKRDSLFIIQVAGLFFIRTAASRQSIFLKLLTHSRYVPVLKF